MSPFWNIYWTIWIIIKDKHTMMKMMIKKDDGADDDK